VEKKIVCFSDIHGQIDKNLTDWFNSHPGDILIFAGDQKGNRLEDGSKFASWITNLPYKYKVIVFGNHDDNYKNVQDYCKTLKLVGGIGLNSSFTHVDTRPRINGEPTVWVY